MKTEQIQNKAGTWKILPLQLIVLMLPLIVRLYQGDSGYGEYPWYGVEGTYYDLFLHFKMVERGLSDLVIVVFHHLNLYN